MLKEFKPHDYQKRGIEQIINEKNVALWWEPGLGKTVTTLTAIKDLWLDYWAISRVLIIAPLKVAQSTWQNEIEEWEHFDCFRPQNPGVAADRRGGLGGQISVSVMIGNQSDRLRAFEKSKSSIISIINRDNVVWLAKTVQERNGGVWPYDMVVLDESTSFKNHSTKRFKALKMFKGQIKRIVELTGTPASNGLEDLWSQIYLLDSGKRLERTITQYRTRYFNHNAYTHQWTVKDGAEKIIMDKVQDCCHSLTAADYLNLPGFIEEDVLVRLTEQQFLRYKRFERDSVLKALAESEDETIIAGSAAVLTNKLLQYASGVVYDEEGLPHDFHDEKLQAFSEIIETATESILVFYKFRFDLDRIVAALTKQHKSFRVYKTAEDLELWNSGKLDVLVASPESCGYGLNLQRGGRRILWYTTTWSHEVYTQANARLYRQGQTKPVIVQRLITQGTVDERVASVLAGKATMHDFVMDYVKEHKGI